MRTSTLSLVFLALLLTAQAVEVRDRVNFEKFQKRVRENRLGMERMHHRFHHDHRNHRMMRMMRHNEVASKEDFIQFVKGFAYGFDIVMGDPAACIRDINNTVTDFENGAKLIGNGIKHLHVKDVAEGLLAFADGVEKLAAALKDCGVIKTTESIIKIVTEIRSGNIKAFVKDEVMHIYGHGRELIHLFKGLYTSFKARDYYNLGEDAGEILAILIEQDSLPVEQVAPKDIYNLVRGVAEGLGSQIGDPSVCSKDIDDVIADFNAAWQDLTYGIKHISVKTISRSMSEFADGIEKISNSMSACGLEKLEEEIRDVVSQIRSGKALQVVAREAVHIFCHGGELLSDFKAVAAYWKGAQFEECGKKVGAIIAFIADVPPASH